MHSSHLINGRSNTTRLGLLGVVLSYFPNTKQYKRVRKGVPSVPEYSQRCVLWWRYNLGPFLIPTPSAPRRFRRPSDACSDSENRGSQAQLPTSGPNCAAFGLIS